VPRRTVEQIQASIGGRIRSYRLDSNLSQEVVASKAGVNVRSLQRLEGGAASSLETFIRIVKALQLEDWFDTLAIIPAINPLLMVEDRPRQRARKKVARGA